MGANLAGIGLLSTDVLLQRDLTAFSRDRLAPQRPSAEWQDRAQAQIGLALREGAFLEAARAEVSEWAQSAPVVPQAFGAWFDQLRDNGPGQYDPLFEFLAEHASLDQFRWFIQQEVAGEAGFDDLVALTQLRMPERAKLELARNYWDEMGRGKPAAMHGPMLGKVAEVLAVSADNPEDIVPESLALANLLVGLAYNRRYAYQSIGALGAIELTAPTRAVKVVAGMDRLGVDRSASHYFRVHATVDIAHARDWRDEVLMPLVASQPELAVHIAEGALMRLQAGARTFERYRRELGVAAVQG